MPSKYRQQILTFREMTSPWGTDLRTVGTDLRGLAMPIATRNETLINESAQLTILASNEAADVTDEFRAY